MPFKDPEKNREYQREWARRNKGRFKERIKQYNKKAMRKNLEWIRQIKKNSTCEMCGESRWYCLEFHHKAGKEERYEAISRMVRRRRSRAVIEEELKKCVILCANCHREFHHKNGY